MTAVVRARHMPSLFTKIRSLGDVVDWGFCTGCGACYSACEQNGIDLINLPGLGIRPQFHSAECASCTKCLSICPGYEIDANAAIGCQQVHSAANQEFGTALEIWEGFAVDPEIRRQGSSGGILSAISLYCLEQEGFDFVLHTGAKKGMPWGNETVKSRTRSELLARTGSRYAPSSPCDGLHDIEESKKQCVFIGKPCDVSAAWQMRLRRPKLERHLGLVLTFFCAGTPNEQGALDLLRTLQVNPTAVDAVRYRGAGWPGEFTVLHENESKEVSLSYHESWARLTPYRPLRCNLCPDGLGRVADISCGDSWGKFRNDRDAGRSLVLVRTERGREILRRAIATHYVTLQRIDASEILSAQPQLLQRRRELFGRLTALRLVGVPIPRYKNFSLTSSWLRLPMRTQLKTILGTVRRAIQRGWWRPQKHSWRRGNR